MIHKKEHFTIKNYLILSDYNSSIIRYKNGAYKAECKRHFYIPCADKSRHQVQYS